MAALVLERDPERLERSDFDVAVVGAGIQGAWVALDAAQRGLQVALLEQGDFGHGTSANSQRIAHGGLRYLQHGDLRRSRESIRERRTLLRIAPHLVQPLPFVVPTYGRGLRSAAVMAAALRLNDLVGFDRNRGLPPSRRLPGGRLLSREECSALFPGFEAKGLTGGAMFQDAQIRDTERLGLSVLRSAREAGAELANYVGVTGFLRQGGQVVGVEARDRIGKRKLRIRARLVISCAGAWTAQALEAIDPALAGRRRREFEVFKAVVLVTRPLVEGVGVAIAGPGEAEGGPSKGYRNFFVTPWKGRSLVGTFHAPFHGSPDRLAVEPEELRGYVEQFRGLCPSVALDYADVKHVFSGLLPRDPKPGAPATEYARQDRIVDHEAEDGIAGCLTVWGVKWTTARAVAERAVDRALGKLGRGRVPCRTHAQPLYGGDLGDPEAFRALESPSKPDGLAEESLAHLVESHGTAYREVLAWCREEPRWLEALVPGRPEIGAEVIHAVRVEMAQKLEDVVLRRLPMGSVGWPGREAVRACADLLASELGWDEDERRRQIEQLQATYRRVGWVEGP